MADEEVKVVWVRSHSGMLRGFHDTCAQWLGFETTAGERDAHHTEICRGCGRFLLTPAADHHGAPPQIDPQELLK